VFIRLTRYNKACATAGCTAASEHPHFGIGTLTMIDNFAILFSTLAILYVAFMAIRMDRARPWFESKPHEVPPPAKAPATEAPADAAWPAPRPRR